MFTKKEMSEEEKKILYYKQYRDESRRQEDLFWEIFYQAYIIGQIEQKSFSGYKKNELRQNYRLLFQMLKEILGFDDENFFKGFCYEIILAGSEEHITGSEKRFRACTKYFVDSTRKEYCQKAYEMHKKYIADFAQINMETMGKYAENLKKIWGLRYGVESRYCIGLQCEIALQEAKKLEEQKKNREAAELLQAIIAKYQDADKREVQLFQGDIFLETAYNFWRLGDIDHMYRSAQAGIQHCIKYDMVETERYYSIYNYIGLKLIANNELEDAVKLYSRGLEDITEKFDSENENYYLFMNNLRVAVGKQGRNIDMDAQSIMNMKEGMLKKQRKEMIYNELCFAIKNCKPADEIEEIYEKCVARLGEEEDEDIRKKADTIYLVSQINAHKFKDKNFQLMQQLKEKYNDSFTEEQDIIYWNSVACYEWENGRIGTAIEIYIRIYEEIREVKYEIHKMVIINFAQLLILGKYYKEAKRQLLFLLDFQEQEILKAGLGDTFELMHIFRITLSICIHMLSMPEQDIFDEKEIKQLLEKIIFCKTIEREKKSFLSRRIEGKTGEDLELYRQLSSRLAELEFSMDVRGEDREYYEKKKMEYTLKLEEQMLKLNQSISFSEWVPRFHLEDIELPKHTVCAEYFAYFNFQVDAPMTSAFADEEDDEIYSYAIFVLGKGDKELQILNMNFIPVENIMEKEAIYKLEEMKENPEYAGGKISEAVEYFYSPFADSVIPFAEGKEAVYLGLDYMLQVFPMDLVFNNWKEEQHPLIMVDSVRYVKEDIYVDVRNDDALIMGGPAYNIQEPEQQSLAPLAESEKECRRIAEIFGTKALVGQEAGKKKLLDNVGKKVVHISTHGEVNWSEENLFRNLTIESYLKLAGYEDWKAGREVENYGNGAITGNDFLLTDMSGTKLAVLSACVSSLGTTRGLEIPKGMRWAMGSAGVGSSIIALWEVEERATAILMILFYRNLLQMPVGKALHEAKIHLRGMTVSDLRKDTTLREIAEEKVAGMNTADRPFAHWKYWAGLVCYF